MDDEFSLGLTGDPSLDLNLDGTSAASDSADYASPGYFDNLLGISGNANTDLGNYSAATSPVSSSSPSSSSSLSALDSTIGAVGSATANVARAVNGTPAVVVGQPGIGAASNTISGLARTLTSATTSFLPLILIGLVVVFLFKAFTKK